MVAELLNANLAYRYARRRIRAAVGTAGASTPVSSGTPRKSRARAASRPMSAQEYLDLCGTRQALEVYAAGLAAQNRTDDQLAELREPIEAMQRVLNQMGERPADRAVLDDLIREDLRFHLCIVAIARNVWLVREVLRLRVVHRVVETAMRAKPIHTLAERHRIQADHEAIFAAIARGDPAAAKAAMERHLQHNPARFSS